MKMARSSSAFERQLLVDMQACASPTPEVTIEKVTELLNKQIEFGPVESFEIIVLDEPDPAIVSIKVALHNSTNIETTILPIPKE
jgi:hypothetical protein